MKLVWNFEGLPKESGVYLVIASEQDFFNGGLTPATYCILEYNAEWKSWNTKAAFTVHAWAKLPPESKIVGI